MVINVRGTKISVNLERVGTTIENLKCADTGEFLSFRYKKSGDRNSRERHVLVIDNKPNGLVGCLDLDDNLTYKTFGFSKVVGPVFVVDHSNRFTHKVIGFTGVRDDVYDIMQRLEGEELAEIYSYLMGQTYVYKDGYFYGPSKLKSEPRFDKDQGAIYNGKGDKLEIPSDPTELREFASQLQSFL